jgi:hypothetical protein
MEVSVDECLSLVSAQDLGSTFSFTSNHWLVCCDPVVEMMNPSLGLMGIRAGLELYCVTMVEKQILELIQCSDLTFGCCKAYLLLSFCIQSVSGFVSGVPFVLTILPYQLDEVAGPKLNTLRRKLSAHHCNQTTKLVAT